MVTLFFVLLFNDDFLIMSLKCCKAFVKHFKTIVNNLIKNIILTRYVNKASPITILMPQLITNNRC